MLAQPKLYDSYDTHVSPQRKELDNQLLRGLFPSFVKMDETFIRESKEMDELCKRILQEKKELKKKQKEGKDQKPGNDDHSGPGCQ